tara:strand:+ start:334 stop:1032 length:699 start_codon:yes stop_codon:yes gene_type:complete
MQRDPRSKYDFSPGKVYGAYTIVEQLEKTPGNLKLKRFSCRCTCGSLRIIRQDRLVKSPGPCSDCSSLLADLHRQFPDIDKSLVFGSHAYIAWNGMRVMEKHRGTPMCAEWRDSFLVYLDFYLKETGLTLFDVVRGRFGHSFYHAERLDKEQPWSPTNTTYIRFVTERARHKPTYNYWYNLKRRELLDDTLLSYKEFVNTFGVKDPTRILRRKDIMLNHSKTNSYWYTRNDR